MKIERFFYDEKEKMLNEIRQEIKTEQQKWEPEKDQRFMDMVKRLMQFAENAACNIKIETDSDRSAMIKMQTDGIWILCNGETSLEEKAVMQELFQKAGYIHIGNGERKGKPVVKLEFNLKFE